MILFVCTDSFKTTRKSLEVTVGFFQFRGPVNKITLETMLNITRGNRALIGEDNEHESDNCDRYTMYTQL